MSWASWGMAAVLAVMFSYVAVRAASFAYFRTRLEYVRSLLRELGKDDRNHG